MEREASAERHDPPADAQTMRAPAELTMLGKTLLNLDQIGEALDPKFDPNASIRRNAAEIMRARGWTSLRAVQERQVYCVRDELLNTPAPTLISGLRALAAAIHPERFPPVPGLRRITEVSREARTPDAPVV